MNYLCQKFRIHNNRLDPTIPTTDFIANPAPWTRCFREQQIKCKYTYIHETGIWLISIWVRALMVPMHLGLIKGSFVANRLISVQGNPVPLLKLQMAPRLQLLMPSVSKAKEPRNAFFFSPKVPVNQLSPGTQQGPMETASRLQGPFYISLKFLIKSSLIKKFFPSLKGPRKWVSLHVPQKRCPMETDVRFQSLT
jgi:hypothetical protein